MASTLFARAPEPVKAGGSLKLRELRLRNFKGQPLFELAALGKDVDLFADNGVGKTTIADALSWLITGKNYAGQDQSKFDIKTYDPENPGEALHGLEHEVYAVFTVEGRPEPISFQKVYREKWATKRGGGVQEFSGHTVDHQVNGVPVEEQEYNRQIGALCDPELWLMLMNPGHFAGNLHWQKRRQIVLDVFGDVTDAEVIESEPLLAELPSILGSLTLAEYRKILDAKRKLVNEERNRIPTRIDEANRAMPAEVVAPTDLEDLRATLKDLNEDLARVRAGGEVAERKKQLAELDSKIVYAELEAKKAAAGDVSAITKELRDLALSISAKERTVKGIQDNLRHDVPALEQLGKDRDALRARWHEENSREWQGSETCSTCGQPLPGNRVESAREAFHLEKSRKLTQIQQQGKGVAARHEDLKALVDKLNVELEAAEPELKALREEMARLEAASRSESPSVAEDPTLIALRTERASLVAEIEALGVSVASVVTDLTARIEEASLLIQEGEAQSARAVQRETLKSRIEELKSEEKRLAGEIERIDYEISLTELFIRTKVKALEEKINSRFAITRFKLFDTQVNGALVECCEVTIDGRPYSTALSCSERINVGLDCINVLSDHFGIAPVVVIDNCESVTHPLPTRGQQIRLIVSESDKVLRAEVRD